jgi:signal transduction histidine kinase
VTTILDELLSYTAFGADDAARLRTLHPLLEPHFPAIAEKFYSAVFASPGASSVLSGPAQIERLRITLIDWMSTGLLGPHDEHFYEKRSRIGQRHVAIGLAHHYMFTAMTVVRLAYQDAIAALLPADEARPVLRSVHKLLDIELAIMVRHYQIDSEQKLVAREQRIRTDRITSIQTLTAGLAHELRNPLNSAMLQLELLERRLKRDGDNARLVEPSQLARNEIGRLTALLGDFLAFARPPELDPHDHDVAQIVRQVADLERVFADRLGVELVLGSCPAELVARIDAPKLHQIVLNLVRNAIEAVSAGGHIMIDLNADDHELVLRVADDGPGIPDSVRGRIYEPFFSTKEGGTGLGMSIVHSLVALHGGAIDLETGPTGTRFTVRIPRT